MQRSTERILTTHVGSLARPPGLLEMMQEKEHGRPYDASARQETHAGADALSLLNSVFGLPGFRGAQEEIVRHVADGGNCLVLMPTGGGKSLCVQLPALLRQGCGIVVSREISGGCGANERPLAFHVGNETARWQRAPGGRIPERSGSHSSGLDLQTLIDKPGETDAARRISSKARRVESKA